MSIRKRSTYWHKSVHTIHDSHQQRMFPLFHMYETCKDFQYIQLYLDSLWEKATSFPYSRFTSRQANNCSKLKRWVTLNVFEVSNKDTRTYHKGLFGVLVVNFEYI